MKQTLNRYISAGMAILMIMSLAGCNQKGTNSGDEGSNPEIVSSDDIIFSHAGGLYEQGFSLALSANINNGIIRYTLDGSDPTAESTQYTEEITIADRTNEENNLSAIIIEEKGGEGFGGNGGKGNAEDGKMPQMSGGFGGSPFQGSDADGELPQMPEGIDSSQLQERDADGELPQGPEGFGGGNRPNGMGGFGGGTAAAPEENVFKGTVVKAAVFSESGEILSDIYVQSYFVSKDIHTRYGDLPIVSIVTDAENFFDEETGIYVNYSESGSAWERPVYFEMFDSDGASVISQNMGVRINGGSTRRLAQKAMRFYAKSSYDEENPTVEYELFDGLTKSNSDDLLTSFKRFLLRASGNDNSGTLFRDALEQSLISDLNVDTQASRPCVAFINGEFWGIYNIRERYDNHYFANHYDIDADNVAVLEISNDSTTPEVNEGDESDLEYYNEMWDFFNENSMTGEENYKKAQEYIDIDNFIDYYIINIYSGNTDWPANNNVFWRYKTSSGGCDETAEWYMDGRFRWVIKDMDFGFGLMTEVTNDTFAHATSETSTQMGGRPNQNDAQNQQGGERTGVDGVGGGIDGAGSGAGGGAGGGAAVGGTGSGAGGNRGGDAGGNRAGGPGGNRDGGPGGGGGGGFTSAESTLMFRKLLENQEFQAKLINRFCDVMNTNYESDSVTAAINEMKATIAPAIEEQANRYSSSVSSVESWEANIDKMIQFAEQRSAYMQSFLQSRFTLSEVVTVTINTDSETGYIRINDTDITADTKGVTDASSWSGSYFSGTIQTFTAVPQNGHTFVKFVVTDSMSGTATEYTESVINITLGSGGTVVQAVFE